jgi:Cu(I)/Ag(I) efflux system membrane protein CusA/SilA
MTIVAIMAGLMPILWATGPLSEVMSRIALPMIIEEWYHPRS